MTTTLPKTKKTTQLLEDVVTERELTDIEFLEEIVRDLDAGWTTGAMCDGTGKCLVGAGAAALGLNYGTVNYSYAAINGGAIDIISERLFVTEFDAKVRAMEFKAARRLLDLLGSRMYEPQKNFDYDKLTKTDVIGVVTGFNDGIVPDYLALRSMLVKKIEELRA